MKFLLAPTLLGATLLASSCRTTSDGSEASEGLSRKNYNYAAQQAADELAQLEAVFQQGGEDLLAMLGHDTATYKNFQKLRNRHVLLLFVKNNGITEDDRRGAEPAPEDGPVGNEPILSSPIEFNLNANLLVNCQTFVNEPGFAQIDKKVFTAIPEAERKQLFCASLRMWPAEDRRVNRGKGDVKEVWLYLDSQYRPFGKELFVYENKSDVRSYRTGLDPAYSVSSQLDGIPYDVPNLKTLGHMLAAQRPLPKVTRVTSVNLPKDVYLQKQLAKRQIKLCPQGNAVEMIYENRGASSTQRVTWCQGDAWPTVIDNPMFIAILAKKPN